MIWRICSNEIDPSPLKIRFFDILDTTEKKTHLHLTLSTEACAADRHRWDYYEVTATVAWPSHKKFHQYNITSNHGFPRLSPAILGGDYYWKLWHGMLLRICRWSGHRRPETDLRTFRCREYGIYRNLSTGRAGKIDRMSSEARFGFCSGWVYSE